MDNLRACMLRDFQGLFQNHVPPDPSESQMSETVTDSIRQNSSQNLFAAPLSREAAFASNRLASFGSLSSQNLYPFHQPPNFALSGPSHIHPGPPPNVEKEWEMGDPIHEDKNLMGRWRNQVGRFINSVPIQVILSIFNIANALILGALTYPCDSNPTRCDVLNRFDISILALFTVELSTQALYLGPVKFFKHGWMLFDLVIILFSWIFIDSSVSVFRSLRIFRLFSLFSRYESLRNLVQAVGRTLPKMATIWFSLMLFFYTFSVLFTVCSSLSFFVAGFCVAPSYPSLSSPHGTSTRMFTTMATSTTTTLETWKRAFSHSSNS